MECVHNCDVNYVVCNMGNFLLFSGVASESIDLRHRMCLPSVLSVLKNQPNLLLISAHMHKLLLKKCFN